MINQGQCYLDLEIRIDIVYIYLKFPVDHTKTDSQRR